jgi:hypothetical protein
MNMHKDGKNFFLINENLGFAMKGFQPRHELIDLDGKSLPWKYYSSPAIKKLGLQLLYCYQKQVTEPCSETSASQFHIKFLKINLFNIFQSKLKPSKCCILPIIWLSVLEMYRLRETLKPILVVARSMLGLRVRIPPGAWIPLSCECCVLSVRGLCDGPISRPEESYRVCVYVCVCVCVCITERDKVQQQPSTPTQWVGSRCQAKKERKKDRNVKTKILINRLTERID